MTNEQYAAYFTPLLPFLRDWRLEYDKDWVIDEVTRRVVVKARSWALICSPDEVLEGTEMGGQRREGGGGEEKGKETYQNEYVLFITMTEDGEMVERVEEWVDSQASLEGMGKLRRRVGQGQAHAAETARERL